MRSGRDPYVGSMIRNCAKSRWLWVFALVLLLATACSSSSEADSASNYVKLPEGSTNEEGLTTTTASGVDSGASPDGGTFDQGELESAGLAQVAQETFDEVEEFYDWYLKKRANSIDRTEEIDVMDLVATPAGRDEVAEALAYNDGLRAEQKLSTVDELYLYSNVETILQADDNTMLLRDCTEQHEINAVGQHLAFWQTNEVRIVVVNGEMLVDSFTTTHNGFLEPSAPIGCAPISFQERSEATSAAVWTALQQWGQNADERSDEDLSELIGDPLRERILDAAGAGPTEGLELDENVETAAFTTVGVDSQNRLFSEGTQDIIVHVESCHRFPEGRSGFDTTTQTDVQALRPGAEQALRFHVLIDTGPTEERRDQVVGIDFLNDRCSA